MFSVLITYLGLVLSPGHILMCPPDGADAMSDAIVAATADSTLANATFDHVAMVVTDSVGDICVAEARPSQGVVYTPVDSFMARHPDAVVMELTVPIDTVDVCRRAASLVGRPYDWAFAPGSEALYCSELVYECFRNADGSPILPTVPMNFAGPDGTVPQFWTHLFDSLGIPVPQGVPGTNPTQLARCGLMRAVQ